MAASEEVIFTEELSAKRRVVRKDPGIASNGSYLLAAVIDEHDMLSIEIQQGASSCSAASSNEWLRSIMNGGGDSTNNDSKNNISQQPKIQKVPRMLREIESNKKCYDPSVVCIGPYHHGKLELESMEKLKITMARQYVTDSRKPIDDLYKKVVEVARDARKCYAEGSTEGVDNDAFTRMMFLDGCFILQFMYCIVNNKRREMKMKSHEIAFVQRDLFLLENQLPFKVLLALMSLRFKEDEGRKMINGFINRTRAVPPQDSGCKQTIKNFVEKHLKSSRGQQDQQQEMQFGNELPVHLLEILRTQLIDKRAIVECSPGNDWYSYRSAKELKAAGIHFMPGKTRRFTDVKYESHLISATLTLPPMTIDDSTKSLLLNLVAYETCPDTPDDFGVTSYLCFMDSLIDHAEDVMELRSKGIILNFLGSDQQVADLFNAIANDLVPNPYAYVGVKRHIEDLYKNKIKIWMTEWIHTHFSSPWTLLAFFGAILALALSVTQTYYAVKDGQSNKKSS